MGLIVHPGGQSPPRVFDEYRAAAALLGIGTVVFEARTPAELDIAMDNAKAKRVDAIATAPGRDGVDFVSRYFAPNYGVDEDPVTGSAHCVLTPYWAARLGKKQLTARQISARGGALACTLRGNRVTIAGHAVLYLEGAITV